MKKNLYLIALLVITCLFPAAAQEKVTGFSDIKLFLDPGHSGTGNQGYGGYSEAEKVLQVALSIKDFLLTYTDMQAENIRLSRQTDNDAEISMSARGDICKTMGAHLLYSIHSDAPSLTSFSSLYMYGGRRTSSGGQVIEKLPEGGKLYGDFLVGDLTSVLRAIRNDGTVRPDISRGNMADLTFYGSSGSTPYLGVNSNTRDICASLLSEAGFHTNPAQNMQFVNVEQKRMQAYAAYQSLVKYFSEKHLGGRIDPVQIGISTGFVFDSETYAPVNGATITVTENETVKTYTTDTYQSLPKKYSFKPEEFGNGFYWLEGFTPGATVAVKVEADGFETQETSVTIPATIGATTIDGLGVKDFQLLNLKPAVVSKVEMKYDLASKVIPRNPMDIVFSRKMDQTSVEAAVVFSPAANVSYSWVNDFTLRINISELTFETDYTLTIDGSVAKNSVTGQFLDGDKDGTEGGDYTLNFATSDLDTDPPVIVSYDPQGDQEIAARPIVRIEFDEPLNELSIAQNQISVTDQNGDNVEGVKSYYTTSNFKSVIHYLFYEDLQPQQTYTVKLAPGIEDTYGNAMAEGFEFNFTARPKQLSNVRVLDDFNTLSSNWYEITGSGSTAGVVATATKVAVDSRVKPFTESTASMRMDYLWDKTHSNPVIRWHNKAVTPQFTKAGNFIQYYVFGDGSKSNISVVLRAGSGGDMWGHVRIPIDWVGWKLITWDLANDPNANYFVGSSSLPDGNVNFSCFAVYPAATVADRYYEVSSIFLSRLRLVQLGDFIPASPNAIGNVSNETGITIANPGDYINVTSPEIIKTITVSSITGVQVKSAQPKQASYQIPTGDLAQGVYIVKVTTGTTQKNVKVLVR